MTYIRNKSNIPTWRDAVWGFFIFRGLIMYQSKVDCSSVLNTVVFLLIVVFMLLSVQVKSEEYLYTGAWSYHIGEGKREGKNETHYLFAYNNSKYLIGTFKNSHYDQVVLGGKKILYSHYENVEVSVYAGAVVGYWQCYGGKEDGDDRKNICLVVIPEITYTKFKLQPSILMLGSAVAISLRWEI